MNRFFVVWPFWGAFVLGSNIWDDASKGRPFNWTNLLLGLGIIAFGGFVYLICRSILSFVGSVVDRPERDR